MNINEKKDISELQNFVPSMVSVKILQNKAGIDFTVTLHHGFGAIESFYNYSFILHENSKNKIEQLLKVLPELKNVIIKGNSSGDNQCTEEMAEKIADKLNMEYKEVLRLIDGVCINDAKFEDIAAVPESYKIVFSDGENILISKGKL